MPGKGLINIIFFSSDFVKRANVTDENSIELVVERSILFDLINKFYYALSD